MVTAYPVAHKKKAFDICLAFIRGCGGQIGTKYRGGPSFFYGVDESNRAEWEQALQNKERDPIFYADNSYFDSRRQVSFRVTKNALQHSGIGETDGARFAALGIEIKPWRLAGEHIVVCPQSDHFMKVLAGYDGDWGRPMTWGESVMGNLATQARPVRYRDWSPNKGQLASTLEQDLEGAHALVTWSSAAAVTAVLSGVPVVVQSNDCAARCMAGDPWDFENVGMPGDRLRWAGVLADNEWTLEELTNGTAWRALA